MHLLYCNVSNQSNSLAEDRQNHPWRPIPVGLISQKNARILRWTLVVLCLCFSSPFGLLNVLASIFMVVITIFYDNLKFSGHWVAKNMCALSGYLCFEVGAMAIMSMLSNRFCLSPQLNFLGGSSNGLDIISLKALVYNSLMILSTIHVQDFPDVEGDTAQNRKTIPILAPVISRILTSAMIIFWSIYMGFIWRVGIWCSGVLLAVGLVIAWRLWFLRTTSEDRISYVIYNVSSFSQFSVIK